METKDLVKKLQEIDPKGDFNVSINGEAISSIELVSGHYDGPAGYLRDNKFYINYENLKVNIKTMSVYDFITNHDGDYSNVKIIGSQRRKNEYLKYFERISKTHIKFLQKLNEVNAEEIMQKISEGWHIVEPIDNNEYGILFFIKDLETNFVFFEDRRVHGDEKHIQLKYGQMQFVKKSGYFISDEFEHRNFLIYKLDI